MVAESTRATFTRMQDGTADDYAKIDQADAEYFAALPTRILAAVAALATDGLSAYTIDRTSHSLQSATRALRAGEEEDYVVAALIHDVGDPLAPFSHGRLAASIIKPFVSPRIAWIVEQHPVFQMYYYAPHMGGTRDARERFRDHEWFDDAEYFTANYDENCFDPDYPSLPLEYFAPMVHNVFSREPAFPETGATL
ncbi:MAG: HD domain-containing protein [Actinomycetes bacterium]